MIRRHGLASAIVLLLLLGAACTPWWRSVPKDSDPTQAASGAASTPSGTSGGPTSPASSARRSGTPPGTTASGGSSSSAAGLKAPLTGLLDRQGVPDAKNQNASVISGVVINLDWAQVQPTADRIDFDLLDQRLAAVDAFGASAGHPVRARLRILGGMSAPDWLKDASGRVPVSHKADGDQGADDFSGDLPRFWTDTYGHAYAQLQRRLAERYDGDPRLADVVISRCATLWAEPFIRQADDGVRLPMFAHGYTVQQDQVCHQQEVAAHQVWQRTRSTLSLSPFQTLAANGRGDPDIGFTLQMLEECRRVLDARCVLANNSIRTPLQTGDYPRLYDAIAAQGDPITFQTAKKDRIGNLPQTVDWAADVEHACSVELPEGYQDLAFAPADRLRAASQRLTANCAAG